MSHSPFFLYCGTCLKLLVTTEIHSLLVSSARAHRTAHPEHPMYWGRLRPVPPDVQS